MSLRSPKEGQLLKQESWRKVVSVLLQRLKCCELVEKFSNNHFHLQKIPSININGPQQTRNDHINMFRVFSIALGGHIFQHEPRRQVKVKAASTQETPVSMSHHSERWLSHLPQAQAQQWKAKGLNLFPFPNQSVQLPSCMTALNTGHGGLATLASPRCPHCNPPD